MFSLRLATRGASITRRYASSVIPTTMRTSLASLRAAQQAPVPFHSSHVYRKFPTTTPSTPPSILELVIGSPRAGVVQDSAKPVVPETIQMDSVKRKRKKMMKKHKLRKRRKAQRALKIRLKR